MRTPRTLPTWLKRIGGKQGFTLVEISFALIILGVGLLVLAQALPRGLSTRDRGRRMTVATQLAQEQVEFLRNLPFDHADLGPGLHTEATPPRTHFRREWTVTNMTADAAMKRVVVQVSFPTSEADSMVTLSTQLTR